MFLTLFICAVFASFALGCLPVNKEVKQGDVFLVWFSMFASSCIVAFPLLYLYNWVIG